MEQIDRNYRYTSEISLDEFRESVVLLFVDDGNRPTVLIKNSVEKTVPERGKTDNLEYRLNSVVEKDGEKFFVHIITCLKDDSTSKEQFAIGFKYLFNKINSPLKDKELSALMVSLESLFKVSKEKDLTPLRTGVFGELVFIDYLYRSGFTEIIDKYHSNFFSKHDIEITDKVRIEIKTSAGTKRIHHFKHDQIFRNDIDVFVGSVLLEQSQEGMTLLALMERVMGYCEDKDSIMSFGQLKGLCGIGKEDPGPSFAYERAISSIKFYEAKELPHLSLNEQPGVTNISYDVDCSLSNELSLEGFLEALSRFSR